MIQHSVHRIEPLPLRGVCSGRSQLNAATPRDPCMTSTKSQHVSALTHLHIRQFRQRRTTTAERGHWHRRLSSAFDTATRYIYYPPSPPTTLHTDPDQDFIPTFLTS